MNSNAHYLLEHIIISYYNIIWNYHVLSYVTEIICFCIDTRFISSQIDLAIRTDLNISISSV